MVSKVGSVQWLSWACRIEHRLFEVEYGFSPHEGRGVSFFADRTD
jgi:hypothetical protein